MGRHGRGQPQRGPEGSQRSARVARDSERLPWIRRPRGGIDLGQGPQLQVALIVATAIVGCLWGGFNEVTGKTGDASPVLGGLALAAGLLLAVGVLLYLRRPVKPGDDKD